MSEFEAKSICILGRQPALGLAELESLYGAEHVRALPGAALLDVAAENINFQRLGGTIKVARLLATLPSDKWESAYAYLVKNIPEHLKNAPEGKFTLGVSVYGPTFSVRKLNADLLSLKKEIKAASSRSVRIVPNKTLQLNSAQVLHNGLVRRGGWELVLVRENGHFHLAQTLFVQDIEAYGARDQARPARDARVGMLPPKLAQIVINLAVGQIDSTLEDKTRVRVLDPFCGTGVVLQEALLMGYSAYGTDIDPRMVEFTKKNLRWLVEKHPALEGGVTAEEADATSFAWPGFSVIASEVFLGRPLAKLPDEDKLKQIISDANTITKKFLQNLAPQLKAGRIVCLAVPAWHRGDGRFVHLPVLDKLTDMGYNYSDFKHVRRQELIYFRPNQVVARQLVVLRKK